MFFFVSLRDTNVSLRKEMWHFLTELNNYNLNVYIFLIESFCFSDLFSYSVPVLGVILRGFILRVSGERVRG